MSVAGFDPWVCWYPDNIRCLFMPACVGWSWPRMGFGLVDELACRDTHISRDITLPGGCMVNAGDG
jgi:hypothetical protein